MVTVLSVLTALILSSAQIVTYKVGDVVRVETYVDIVFESRLKMTCPTFDGFMYAPGGGMGTEKDLEIEIFQIEVDLSNTQVQAEYKKRQLTADPYGQLVANKKISNFPKPNATIWSGLREAQGMYSIEFSDVLKCNFNESLDRKWSKGTWFVGVKNLCKCEQTEKVKISSSKLTNVSLSKILENGRFEGYTQTVSAPITKENIPAVEKSDVNVVFFKLCREILLKDVAGEYQRMGLKPNPIAQAIVNAQDNDFEIKFPNVSVWLLQGKLWELDFHGADMIASGYAFFNNVKPPQGYSRWQWFAGTKN